MWRESELTPASSTLVVGARWYSGGLLAHAACSIYGVVGVAVRAIEFAQAAADEAGCAADTCNRHAQRRLHPCCHLAAPKTRARQKVSLRQLSTDGSDSGARNTPAWLTVQHVYFLAVCYIRPPVTTYQLYSQPNTQDSSYTLTHRRHPTCVLPNAREWRRSANVISA
jgi:hypothetical protein